VVVVWTVFDVFFFVILFCDLIFESGLRRTRTVVVPLSCCRLNVNLVLAPAFYACRAARQCGNISLIRDWWFLRVLKAWPLSE
jgi:hypothetical protein